MTTNRAINARFIRKDPGSGTEHCPARYDVPAADGGGSFVVGTVATPEERATIAAHGIGIGPDELLVFVPNGVLEAS